MCKSRVVLVIATPFIVACPEPEGDQGTGDASSETSSGDGDGDGDGDDCQELTPAGPDSSAMIRSCEPHELDPQLDPAQAEALATDNLAFGLDLYHALREDKAAGEGFAISPYSLRSAFGMLYGGTVEPARTEIASTLHFSLLDEQHDALNWLDAQLLARNLPALEMADPVILQPVNGAWIFDDFVGALQPSYLDLLSIHYDTGMFLAKFKSQPEIERLAINAWVAERTHDLIPELFGPPTIDSFTRFVLVNALYLKSPWATPFDADYTTTTTFTLLDETPIDVDMMFNPEMLVSMNQGVGWQAITVPLRGEELVFVVILPDDFAAFEASLDVDTLETILEVDEFGWGLAALSLPRFELESGFELDVELKQLGMLAPFEDPNSFAGMIEGQPLVIHPVVQKTAIVVEEGGIEAAAASGIVGLSPPSIPPEVLIDRPFLLAIHDRPTNTLLFLGRVLDPTKE